MQFQQTHRPANALLLPIVIAGVVLAAVAAGIYFRSPHTPATVALTQMKIVPTKVTYSNDSNTLKILGKTDADENTLFVVATVKVHNNLDTPLSLKDYTAKLTTAEGAELETSASEKDDAPAVFTAFPEVRAAAANGKLLLRDSEVPAKGDLEGILLLGFKDATQATWDKRKSAEVAVAPYHMDAVKAELK